MDHLEIKKLALDYALQVAVPDVVTTARAIEEFLIQPLSNPDLYAPASPPPEPESAEYFLGYRIGELVFMKSYDLHPDRAGVLEEASLHKGDRLVMLKVIEDLPFEEPEPDRAEMEMAEPLTPPTPDDDIPF